MKTPPRAAYGRNKSFVARLKVGDWFFAPDFRTATRLSAAAYAMGLRLRRRICKGVGGFTYTRIA